MRVDRFELEEELGRGGMGVVYRARDGASGGQVALKVLPALADTEELRRALVEARAGSRLEHPGIARLLEAGRDAQGRHWIALELVAGETLQARLTREGPLPLAEALRVARDLAGALEHAHARGVLHRDLKPGNVMLGPEGRVVLLDLGLARLLDRETRITGTGEALGTPAFMAPEQVRGERERIGPATDVYGLSATLYALLTGAPPFGDSSTLEALRAVLERPAPSPRALRPEVPSALDALVRRGLAKAPEERFPTASALRGALEAAGRPPAPTRRGRAPLLVAALLAGLAAAGGLALRGAGPGAAASPGASGSASALGSPAAPGDDLTAARARVHELLRADQRRAAVEEARRGLQAGEDPELRWLLARAFHGLAEWAPAQEALELALRGSPSASWRAEAAALQARLRAISPLAVEARDRVERGELDGALARADQAVALGPQEPYALLARAWVRMQAGQPGAALEDVEAVLGRDPRQPQALELRAFLQRGLPGGRLEEALRCLGLALETDPISPSLIYTRALVRTDVRDLEGAWADVERLERLVLPPEQRLHYAAGALALRARLHRERGQLQEARGDLDGYLSLRPDDPATLLLRAGVLEELGDLAGAEADHRRLVALGPPDAPWAVVSRAWLQAGSFEQLGVAAHRAWTGGDLAGARLALDCMVQLRSHDPAPLLRRATVRRAEADPRGALEDARRAAELAPELAGARWEEAAALLSLGGRAPEARAAVERGLTLEPGDPQGRLMAARVCLADGDAGGALSQLGQVATPDPGVRAAVELMRAQAHLALDDAVAARAACDAGIALEPANALLAELHGFRAMSRGLLGEREAALADRERVHELLPGSAVARTVDERLRELGIP